MCTQPNSSENIDPYTELVLNIETLTEGVEKMNYDMININGRLGELCELFQDEVYNNGIHQMLEARPHSTASGIYGSLLIFAAEQPDWTRVAISRDDCSIVFQRAEHTKRLYLLNCDGTLPAIRSLVRTAVEIWRNDVARAAFTFVTGLPQSTRDIGMR